VPASLFMAITKTLIKAIATTNMHPDEILTRVNRELCKDNDTMMFVTIFSGILDTKTGEMYYSNGGHNLPYLINQNEGISALGDSAGIALGIHEEAVYKRQKVTLHAGDWIFLYTDGVTEAMDIHENLFSDERLMSLLEDQKHHGPEESLRKTLNELKNFSSGAPQADDITLLALKYRNNG